MKRILMIAYHFPPLAGSSGIQRTLRFVQHWSIWASCKASVSSLETRWASMAIEGFSVLV
jgi:hypothetical protein